MPPGDPVTGAGAADWSWINNGVKELIDQILVSHRLVHALDSSEALPLDGIKSATADPRSLADMDAPSDHRPVSLGSTSSTWIPHGARQGTVASGDQASRRPLCWP
jgi:hypothetical protein